MGKPTGFMEYPREPKHERPPAERVKDWSEEHPPYGEDTLRKQGARCMDCGIPFCHTGKLVAGMAMGCPVNNLIPEWNDLVYRGQWEEAYIRLAKTNNFPEFTGRVCPAPCEGSCTLGINDPPVTIKLIEQEIVDRAFAAGLVKPQPPPVRTGKRVAVVGSGPAGLACGAAAQPRGAHRHRVRARRPGRRAPHVRHPEHEARQGGRRAAREAASRTRASASSPRPRSASTSRPTGSRRSTTRSCSAAAPRRRATCRSRGGSSTGIHLAMDFLAANTKSLLDSQHADGKYVSAKGKDVVVIGGGDTGTDCVGTSIRHGARSVVQLEILPRPPDERAADNPWPQWPKTLKTDYGQEEAKALWGKDPRDFAGPHEALRGRRRRAA